MPWQNNKSGGGGGPWGSGGGGNSGGSGGGSGGNPGPWGRGPSGQRPTDFEDMLRRSQDRFRRAMPGGFGSGRSLAVIAAIAFVLWMASGTYVVDADEQGVEMRFGKYTATTDPGLRYNWPAPIGSVMTPKVTVTNRVEIGFRSGGDPSSRSAARDVPAESLMLTGDENIIDIQFVVLWQIKNAGKFLFNVRDPEDTVHNVAEASMREIIGQTPFEIARTQGRGEIQARAMELIQHTLDSYDTGILVKNVEMQKVDPPAAVIEAFRDVQAARADKERATNEGQAYFNEVTQRAEGQAQRLLKEAEAYKEQSIAIASGDAQRFLSVQEQYRTAQDVTRRRMYLETMEQVMRGMNKVLIEEGAGGGTVPYLSLNELARGTPPAENPEQPRAQTGAGQ